MEAYKFKKSFLERIEEAEKVLSWDSVIPASQVFNEWKSYVELQIEPTGWSALWKVPRVICEDLGLHFPTIVCGYVDDVSFCDLKATFIVTNVPDNDIHMPERNYVALIDLWPTISQVNDALNVEKTADCIDALRFFFTHVWMPWDKDSDGDRDWMQMHFQARIQLACDLSNNKLQRTLALRIRTLLMEANYIQQRLDFLEMDLSSDSDDDGIDEECKTVRSQTKTVDVCDNLNKSKVPVTDLMSLHLRLAVIRSEFEILENPEMRRVYSELSVNKLKRTLQQCVLEEGGGDACQQICHLVALPGEFHQQLQLLQLAKKHVDPKMLMQMNHCLQEVLSTCNPTDRILLSPGQHSIKFLEQLIDNGGIMGLPMPQATIFNEMAFDWKQAEKELAILASTDDDGFLFVVEGEYTLSHMVLDCRRVRRGIFLRSGTLRLHSCRLIGDGESSTQEGIVCMPETTLLMENCIVENFAVAISIQSNCCAELTNVIIKNCDWGLELLDKTIKLNLQCTFKECKLGLVADGIEINNSKEPHITVKQFHELQQYTDKNFQGSCEFYNCGINVRIMNESLSKSNPRNQHVITDHELANKSKENMI